MFLKDLNDDERRAFLELAHQVAEVDGDLAGVEAEMLAYFRIELGLDDATYPIQGMAVADAAACFASDESRRAALMELMLVVMADGVAHPGEHALLAEVAEHFAIDDDTAERQFAWVQRLMALVATGKRLIEVGDPMAV
jgi:uncharacterized tellurite resistance protein B-like protein